MFGEQLGWSRHVALDCAIGGAPSYPARRVPSRIRPLPKIELVGIRGHESMGAPATSTDRTIYARNAWEAPDPNLRQAGKGFVPQQQVDLTLQINAINAGDRLSTRADLRRHRSNPWMPHFLPCFCWHRPGRGARTEL